MINHTFKMKLQEMSPLSPESSSVRNYLELMADLPWSKETRDNIDIQKARENFDADHFGMVDVKKRVLEYLAVQKLRQSLKGPILCFVGPPGVGKTSIARSIAYTMGRKFHRISLGGVSDQSDIRGHRRTYIGSMPGRIIQGVKRARVRNPVFLLDEIDKLSAGIHGDPAAALLEVLDPEQNSHFVDHYVNVQFDLSKVLFVATANSTSTIPAALMDRMEVIQVSGYTRDEKVAIATRYLIPKQVKEHGLVVKDEIAVDFKPEALQFIVGRYTREAGVRSLERRVGAVCRAVALRHAELPEDSVQPPHHFPNVVIDVEAVEHILGPAPYGEWRREEPREAGVAAGLAWTPFGGEVLYVEATRMDGDGKLTLTGQLGDVMKESATLALNWLRAHAQHVGRFRFPTGPYQMNCSAK